MIDFFFGRGHFVKTIHADFQPAQGFLHGLLKGAADGHDFTHGFHLRGQPVIGLRKFLKRKARDLGDHVINRRLKRRGCCAARDVVFQFIQGVAHSQLGGDLGNRKTRGF